MSQREGYKLEFPSNLGEQFNAQIDLDTIFVLTPSGQKNSVSFLLHELRDLSLKIEKLLARIGSEQ